MARERPAHYGLSITRTFVSLSQDVIVIFTCDEVLWCILCFSAHEVDDTKHHLDRGEDETTKPRIAFRHGCLCDAIFRANMFTWVLAQKTFFVVALVHSTPSWTYLLTCSFLAVKFTVHVGYADSFVDGSHVRSESIWNYFFFGTLNCVKPPLLSSAR